MQSIWLSLPISAPKTSHPKRNMMTLKTVLKAEQTAVVLTTVQHVKVAISFLRVFRSPPFRRTSIFWPASKDTKNAPTQQERWLGQTETRYKSANFDSTLYAQVKLFFTASKFDDGCHPILCNCPALISLLRRGRLTSHMWVSANLSSLSDTDSLFIARAYRLSRVSGRLPIISWWQKI